MANQANTAHEQIACPATANHLPPASFTYSKWRHGGWYVHEVRYPSGACGCVSRNYSDGKWRIACDPRPFEDAPTFKNRDEAARAEYDLAEQEHRNLAA